MVIDEWCEWFSGIVLWGGYLELREWGMLCWKRLCKKGVGGGGEDEWRWSD